MSKYDTDSVRIIFYAINSEMKIVLINKRIREIRDTIGFTQAVFAKQIAISTSYLGGIELNARVANERIIRLIVTEFNVNEQWLRTGEGEMFNSNADTSAIKALSLFNSLDQHFQSYAIEQLELLSNFHTLIKKEKGFT